MAVIFYQSSLTNAPLPRAVSDKVAHAVGYGVLGALVVRALVGGFPRPVNAAAAVIAVVMSVLYGVSDEWHQSFVPGRTADVSDLVADGTGAAIAVCVAWACGILWPRLVRGRSGVTP